MRQSYNGAMLDLCHRCHGELPLSAPGTQGNQSVEERALYCPHCGAPQLRLPDYMRHESDFAAAVGENDEPGEEASTGRTPPPRPHEVNWRIALSSSASVALIAAVLVVTGLKIPFASFLSTIWVIGAAALALGLYSRRNPEGWIDGPVGLRVGLATGVMVLAMIAAGLALTGVVLRFGLHRMAGFDADVAQQMHAMQQQLGERMAEQQQPVEFRDHMLGFLGSPEVRGGLGLFYLATSGLLILLFAAGGGAFAGMMRGTLRAARTSR
jgi:hypothetical protein